MAPNAGHAYVGGGDMPRPTRLPLGLLCAKLRKDAKTGFVQIVRVLRGNRARMLGCARR